MIKSLYSLKQGPKQSHEKFDNTMIVNGFKITECDKCVYIKELADSCVIMCLYVNDILITSTNKKVIKETKKMVSLSFDIKDMSKIDAIFGVRVKQTFEGYLITQSHYIDKIPKKSRQFDYKLAITPFEANCKLRKNINECKSQLEYSQVIGSLMYIVQTGYCIFGR